MSRFGSLGGKNHGYGKSMNYAGHNAIKDHFSAGHHQSTQDLSNRWEQFAEFAKENGAKDARFVSEELVKDWGQQLIDQDKSVSTIHSYVSAINTVMSQMRENNWSTVSPSEIAGHRDYVRTNAPSAMDRDKVENMHQALREHGELRADAVAGLGRETGMRMTEALSANLDRLMHEAKTTGTINVIDNTKGGRTEDRIIELSSKGIEAIEYAISIRPDNSNNLIAKNETLNQAVNSLNSARNILKKNNIPGFHDLRTSYACERYEKITGQPAPCVAGERLAERGIDREARLEISHELGHAREDVLTAYIGSSK